MAIRRKFLCWCMMCIAVTAMGLRAGAASRAGSLRIRLQPGAQALIWQVADENVDLTEPFRELSAGCLQPDRAAELLRYARQEGIGGTEGKPETGGWVAFENLDPGVYLVKPEDGQPVLVRIPTEINGEPDWDVEIYPKTGETTPGKPSKLPQTGPVRWPAWGLALAGLGLVLLGADKLRGE